MRPQTVSDEEILAKAREVFLKLGHTAPVTAIAEGLGVSQPALFKRFGTKQNLFIEAMKPPKDIAWMNLAEKGPDNRPFKEQLEELLAELFAFFKILGPLIQVVKMSNITPAVFLHSGEEPVPVKALRVLVEWLEKCKKAGLIRDVDGKVVAVSILGACHMDAFIGSVFEENKVNRSVIANNQEQFVDFYVRALENR